MEQKAPTYPEREDTELFVRQAALLEREFQASSHDVIKQADICVESGTLHALNGHHETALEYFYDARSRYNVDSEAACQAKLKQLDILIANSLRRLSLSINDGSPDTTQT